MRKSNPRLLIPVLALLVGAAPRALRSQILAGPSMGPAPTMEAQRLMQKWHVVGKVTDLRGQAVRDAAVRIDPGMGMRFVRLLTTDVQGLFKTDYTLDLTTQPSLSVNVLVEREGYHPAREFVDFGVTDRTSEIDIMLRPDSDANDDELPVGSLVEQFAPKLRASLETTAAIAPLKTDFDRGAQAFLDRRDPAAAVPFLSKIVKRSPDCGHCRTFLGLALLQAGDWNGAAREFVEADKLYSAESGPAGKADKVNSLVIVAEMQAWKGDFARAAGFLVQAKDLDPKNPLVLEELGRTLVLQKNWEAADLYLGEALAVGAPKEAMLLRARALLEDGDPEAAEAELKDYLGDAHLSSSPISVRRLYDEVEARLKLRAYARVQSMVSEPLPSLVEAVPELQGIEPAASQDELAAILQKAGENVKAFFDSFQNTVSTEQIREERLAKDGKLKGSLDQKFQYLLLAKPQRTGLGLQEFRTDTHGEQSVPTGLDSGLMLTSGFASASLLFHPAYQSGATFRYLGSQSLNGRACRVVAFAQSPNKAQMVERFDTGGGSVLVLFQGLAWIDAETYKIVRLRTDLLKPQNQIRLQRQTTEITYDPVQFKQVAYSLWLPSQVAVTLQWAGKTYHNTHRYSDFRLFNTGTHEKVQQLPDPVTDQGDPPQPPAENPPAVAPAPPGPALR